MSLISPSGSPERSISYPPAGFDSGAFSERVFGTDTGTKLTLDGLKRIAPTRSKIIGIVTLLLATCTPAQSKPAELDIMTGCYEVLDVDGEISIDCEDDSQEPRPAILNLVSEDTPLDERSKIDILYAWNQEYMSFPNNVELAVSSVVEGAEFPDAFYHAAQAIINDPNFDTLHFQLLGDVYRNALVYNDSTPEQKAAFYDLREELVDHVGYLDIHIPDPGKI